MGAPGPLTAEDGRAARKLRPRSAIAELTEEPGRDPIAITSADDADRLQELLPERYLRMSATSFTFYRGSAAVMAHDLGRMPSSGITTQLCGDAHISNFGVFSAPDRRLVFDVNDFDETAPGPFEWDVQRLAASVVLAGREIKAAAKAQRKLAFDTVERYRSTMVELAAQHELDVWYDRIEVSSLEQETTSKKMRARVEAQAKKARSRDAMSAVRKITETVDGKLQFRNDPPLLVRLTEVDHELATSTLASYRSTLQPDRQQLLDRFDIVDVAFKAVGVGSVGTRCLVALLIGRDHAEPLLLQLKEAGTSVLDPFNGIASPAHEGERVVEGQRLMQGASDIFLGWTTGPGGRNFYWRQLRDMKYSPDLSLMEESGLLQYAQVCGAALARAHARAGNRAAIAAYVGSGAQFPDAVADFAVAYADLAEADYQLLLAARKDGSLPT